MQATANSIQDAIARISRDDGGRLLSCLIADLRDIGLAEDSVQDAYESALIHWQRNGLPRNPQGWLMQTARRKAIDRLRRASNFKSKQPEYAALLELEQAGAEQEEQYEIPDERLRLIFTCCHPSLERTTSVALTLRTLCGLTTSEIAKAFVVKDDAMAQRLVRARQKITKAGIPYEVPEQEEWGARLDIVLNVLYLIFNAGYSASPSQYIRHDLCEEAVRLAKIVLTLCPEEAEVEGLLALLLLHHARSATRLDAAGEMIALDQQDRALWDEVAIAEGQLLLDTAMKRAKPGPYQLQAAIAAVHATAPTFEDTDWAQIALLYARLLDYQANPVVELNRIVALSYAQGAESVLFMLQPLAATLDAYQPFHAARADILRRCGDVRAADDAYGRAIVLSQNPAEQKMLRARRDEMLAN